MNRDQIICPCLDITAGQIMDAYKEGAKSVEAIKEVTGAGTACGACLDEIEELIPPFLFYRSINTEFVIIKRCCSMFLSSILFIA